ncbi:hypothetical protein BDV95DRAFT_386606 [Massariosphaeria phaeospora]|uniref:Uncharacterized protein n=1 Tax=Massariosphaeria phaeospora TaxID=100035 RepID=A0A7C8IF03_9PLEO|nr:hypothetical protein BDV95DRAFT_386606 [Massariosphaeria phaeospora]
MHPPHPSSARTMPNAANPPSLPADPSGTTTYLPALRTCTHTDTTAAVDHPRSDPPKPRPSQVKSGQSDDKAQGTQAAHASQVASLRRSRVAHIYLPVTQHTRGTAHPGGGDTQIQFPFYVIPLPGAFFHSTQHKPAAPPCVPLDTSSGT